MREAMTMNKNRIGCNVKTCVYNTQCECTAEKIEVGCDECVQPCCDHCAGPLRKRPNTKEKGTDGFGGMKPAERSSVSFSYACLCSCSKTPSEKSARTIFISSGTKAGINSFVSLMSYVIILWRCCLCADRYFA